MKDQFNTFLDQISKASGNAALCEAIRAGYRVILENGDDEPDILAKLRKDFKTELHQLPGLLGYLYNSTDDINLYSALMVSAQRILTHLPDVTHDVILKYFGTGYAKKPISDMKNVDGREMFLYGAKQSGYNSEYLILILGSGLLTRTGKTLDESIDDVFDAMVEEIKLDPLSYVDDSSCLFNEYARTLVSGEDA